MLEDMRTLEGIDTISAGILTTNSFPVRRYENP